MAHMAESFQRMSLNTSSATSASTLGHDILDRAVREQLVTVTSRAVDDAQAWLYRAGPAGIRFSAASQPESQLLEQGPSGTEDVQGIFSDMLATQPSSQQQGPAAASLLHLRDVHSVRSVCGNFKPDILGSFGSDPLASNTGLLLDLKRQPSSSSAPGAARYNCASHFHMVCKKLICQHVCVLDMATVPPPPLPYHMYILRSSTTMGWKCSSSCL